MIFPVVFQASMNFPPLLMDLKKIKTKFCDNLEII